MNGIPRRLREMLFVCGVGASYLALALVSQRILFTEQYVCAFWPAAGIGVVAVSLRKWSGALGVFLGSAAGSAVYFWDDLPVSQGVAIGSITAIGATLEALLAARILAWVGGSDELLDRFHAQAVFCFFCVGCGSASALCGVSALLQFGALKIEFAEALLLWAVGDVLGIILVTPCALSFLRKKSLGERDVPAWVGPVFLATTAALAVALFVQPHPITNVLLLALLASCFYLNRRWTLTAALLVALIATFATMHGKGPLVDPGGSQHLNTHLNLYVFLFVLGVVSLTVSAGVLRQIQRAAEKGTAEREMMKELVELSPVGIGLMDERALRFVEVNKLLAIDMGYGKADGTQADEQAAHDMQSDGQAADNIFGDSSRREEFLTAMKEAGTSRVQREFEARDRNQQAMAIHLSARIVERGKTPYILLFARDITNKKRRVRVTELLITIAHILSTAKPDEPWLSECLYEATQRTEAKHIILWLASKTSQEREPMRFSSHFVDALGDRGWSDIGSDAREGASMKIRAIEEQIYDLHNPRDPAAERALHFFEIFDDRKHLVGVVAVHRPGWLFVDRNVGKGDAANELPLKGVMETVGQMLAEAYWRDIAEERNRRITEMAPVGIFYADADGETVHINAECMKIQGMSDVSEMKTWREKLTGDCRARVGEKWKAYVAERTAKDAPEADPIHSDDEHYPRGNGVRVVRVAASPVRVQGRVAGFVGILIDVTEYESRLSRLNDDRDAVLIQMHEINHDIKNSLYSLKASLQRLDAVAGNRPELADSVARAMTCHDDIEGLAGDAGPESQKTFAPMRMVEEYKPGAAIRGKVLRITGSVPSHVSGPRHIFSRVLRNIILNATNQDDVKSVTVHLEMGLAVDGPSLNVRVSDDGGGLPSERREILKRPVPELRSWLASRNQGEKGRGLPLCRLALVRLGCDLIVEADVPGQYNAFAFSIPAAPAQSPSLPEPAQLEFRGSVLLVDDESKIRADIALRLLDWGVSPLVICSSFEEAEGLLRAIRQKYFDLILLDQKLVGERNGSDLCQFIKQNPFHRDSRTVSISVAPLESADLEAAGFDHGISKSDLTTTEAFNALWNSEAPASRQDAVPRGCPVVTPEIEAAIRSGLEGWSLRLGVAEACDIVAKVAELLAMLRYRDKHPEVAGLNRELHNLRHDLYENANLKKSERKGFLVVLRDISGQSLALEFFLREMRNAIGRTHQEAPED